jgi:hypothetical protein
LIHYQACWLKNPKTKQKRSKYMLNNSTLELTIETLFNEISEDLAESINGGIKTVACHGQMIL